MRKIYFITRFDHETREHFVICAASSEKKAKAWVRFYEYANKGVYYYSETMKDYRLKYSFRYDLGYMHTELPYTFEDTELPF